MKILYILLFVCLCVIELKFQLLKLKLFKLEFQSSETGMLFEEIENGNNLKSSYDSDLMQGRSYSK